MRIEDLESGVEAEELETEKDASEAKMAELETRLNQIQEAKEKMDGELAKTLEKNEQLVKDDIEKEQEKQEQLKQKVLDFEKDLQDIEDTNIENQGEISTLQMLGEDVSEGQKIIAKRTKVIEDAKAKIRNLKDSLGMH